MAEDSPTLSSFAVSSSPRIGYLEADGRSASGISGRSLILGSNFEALARLLAA